MYPIELPARHRCALLIAEAMRWVGVQEIGGNNRGQVVELFQKTCYIAPGDPWCMAFVQSCITRVDLAAYILNPSTRMTTMARGASCVQVWNRTGSSHQFSKPAPGYVVVW